MKQLPRLRGLWHCRRSVRATSAVGLPGQRDREEPHAAMQHRFGFANGKVIEVHAAEGSAQTAAAFQQRCEGVP